MSATLTGEQKLLRDIFGDPCHPAWMTVCIRAQRHGWRVYLGEYCAILQRGFYRKGRRPRDLFVMYDNGHVGHCK